jgi:hypothetical protein
MFKIADKLIDHLNLKENQNAIYELSILIIIIIFIAHFCGCSFIFLAISENNYNWSETNWLRV